jgi:tRNA(Ile)-lysidine synthase TilS/MesJ
MARNPEEVYTDKLLKKICRKTGTTIRDHGMIEENDHILVGISGGKDSMILLETLAERKRALPFEFQITAAHVEASGIGYHIDKEKLGEFCENLGIPLKWLTIEPEFDKDPSKTTCFVCSWYRRKKLFALTRELGCNKLALGHHRQDAIETLMLNMIYHGSISSLPYTLRMFDGRVLLIRPLMDLDERLLDEYARLNEMVHVEKSCPHEDHTQRQTIAELISYIETVHPTGPYNMFRSMNKIFEEYLPRRNKESI